MYENRREVKCVNFSVKRKVNNNYHNMTGTINLGVVYMVVVLAMSESRHGELNQSISQTTIDKL